ncbi:MAG: hypothetical protein H0T73_06180 [Ardenticatenales bacterium]|nr:hypothetical protein [Ardenticatenales bacterium]
MVYIVAELRNSGTNTNEATVTSTEDPSGASDTEDVSLDAGPPYQLGFRDEPTTVTAGTQFTVTLELQDEYGNATTDTGLIPDRTVVLSLDNANGATLQGTASSTSSTGVFMFTNLFITKTNSISYTLTATETNADSGIPLSVTTCPSGLNVYCLTDGTVTSDGFDILPGTLAEIVFDTGPSSATAGSSISPPIQLSLYDTYGNLATNWTDDITLSLEDDPNSTSPFYVDGVLGSATATPSNGLVTFTEAISITQTGTGFTLLATSTNAVTEESGTFNITVGAAHHLEFTVQPTSTITAGSVFSPSVKVEVRDQYENLVTTDTNRTITMGISGGAFATTATITDSTSAGEAIFNNLVVTQTGTYTIAATATGLISTDNASFTITAAALSTMRFSQQPTTILYNTDFSPAIAVQLTDQYGNARTDNSVAITLTVASSSNTAGVLDGTTTVNTTAGVATFTGLDMDELGTHTLQAASTGLTSVTSSSFIIHGDRQTISFHVQHITSTVNVTMNTFSVKVIDSLGNIVSTGSESTPNIRIGLRTSTGTSNINNALSGTSTCTDNTNAWPVCVVAVAGVATFSDVKVVTGTSGDYRIRANKSNGTSISINSSPFVLQ